MREPVNYCSPLTPPRAFFAIGPKPLREHDYVFISYAREDAAIANALYLHLKEAGVEAWLDTQRLLGGQQWAAEVRRAIRGCRYFVALLSAQSVSKRGYVQKELKYALDMLDEFPVSEVFIVPVRLDDCSPRHERLRELQWVDLFPSYSEGFRSVLRSIGGALFRRISLSAVYGEPNHARRGESIAVRYRISNSGVQSLRVWLGASLVDRHGRDLYDTMGDAVATLLVGTNELARQLTVPEEGPVGRMRLFGAVYVGKSGSPINSVRLDRIEAESEVTIA